MLEHPNLVSDVAALYGFDLYDVVLSPSPARIRTAMLLVERLHADSHRSLYQCIDVMDRPDLYGWDRANQFRAAQIDAVNFNTTMTARTGMAGLSDFPIMPEVPTPFASESVPSKDKDSAPVEPQKVPELTPDNTFTAEDAASFFRKS